MKIASACVTGLFFVFAAAHATPAAAAAPKVSGKYALMGWSSCQAKFTTKSRNYKLPTADPHSGPAVWELSPGGLGQISVEAGYVTFTPSAAGSTSGTFAGTTTSINGSALAIITDGTPHGTSMKQKNGETFSGAYSATDTTFTIGGDEFVLSFGNVVQGGVARQINLVRRDSATCAVALSFTR
jgi:hypothetical protein